MRSEFQHDVSVLIGRFQPFDRAHERLLQRALELAAKVVVVVGSAYHAASPRHPFDWRQRAEMIAAALPPPQQQRVHFVPLRDHVDEARWLAELRHVVQAAAPARPQGGELDVVVVGHVLDPTRDYLDHLEGWRFEAMPRQETPDAALVRAALLGSAPDAPATLAAALPAGTLASIEPWMRSPARARLGEEWELLRRHDEAWSAAPYPVVLVTVDCVVRCSGHVLAIRRGHAPGQGLRAMPGGFIELRETTLQSALRELEEETHLDVTQEALLQALRRSEVFDRPERSERGRTITHGFFFDLGDRPLPAVRADDDAASAGWIPLGELAAHESSFLDDHFQMLDHFLHLLPRPGAETHPGPL